MAFTNQNLELTSAGVIKYAGANTPGWVSNLGCTLSAGLFSITAFDGSALSITNPGWVTLPSKASPGQLKTYKITANQGFIDDAGASEIINNLLGSDDGAGAANGVAWANDCPFYIYAVSNDAETAIAFMLSRIPHATRSPVTAAIGAPDDPVADADGDFFSFDNIDETLYDENPCLCIGAIRMRKSALEDWTVQALTDQDGIGRFHEDTLFTYPQGHHGAAASSHIKLNGGVGSVPVFTTNTYTYKIKKNGQLKLNVNFDADGGTDGTDAVSFLMTIPLSSFEFSSDADAGIIHINSSVGGNRLVVCRTSDGGNQLYLLETDGTNVQLADFGNGARTIKIPAILEIVGPSTA